MKTNNITGVNHSKNIGFKSLRKSRNAVSQLAKNNPYSLNEPNSRFISTAIQKLSKVGKSKNIEFLLDTAAKTTYSTNIKLEYLPKNNWKTMLLAAASSAVALLAAGVNKNWFMQRIDEISKNADLTPIEQEILDLRNQLISVVDLGQIKKESKGSMKNFEANLDYLVVSSETTLEHKKYILERLNYFMSDEYEINPQLKDKKSIVVAEMVNDMAINVPGNDVPNIKSVNQHRHGMCAAISIVRKKLAYEDKPNYVDGILSELDSSDKIMVYDRSKLGSGIKVPVCKVEVDFDTAIKNGYRIIDASTMHWMQIAQMSGISNFAFSNYNPFDKENFDVKTDSFLNAKIDEPDLEKAQEYYQALGYTLDLLKKYKASHLAREEKVADTKQEREENLKLANKYGNLLKDSLKKHLPIMSDSDLENLFSLLVAQEKANSSKIKQGDVYSYIPNEEESIKKEKIQKLIFNKTGVGKLEGKVLDEIFELIRDYNSVKTSLNTPKKPSKIAEAQSLYKIAAAFRYQVIKSLEEKGTFYNLVQREGLSNKESVLAEHIDNLINKLESNSSNSDLIIARAMNVFEDINPVKEEVIDALKGLKAVFTELMTEELDAVYKSLTLGSRHEAMVDWLYNMSTFVELSDKKDTEIYATMFGVKNDKDSLNNFINTYIEKIQKGDEQAYIEIFDKMGHTSQLEYVGILFKEVLDKLMEEENGEAVLEFAMANDITNFEDENIVVNQLEMIKQKVNAIGNFIDIAIKELQILDEEGDVLYTGDLKTALIKKLEDKKFIASAKNLKILQEHFNNVNKHRTSDEFGRRRGVIKNPELLKFTKRETETLNETRKDINAMLDYVQNQSEVMRKELKDSLEELNRIIGLNRGKYWVMEGSSGLYTEEQIRLLEYMTGRHHYSTQNLKEAFEQIKTTPYSGISSSSVYHNDNGWHAQYIADIAPIKVQVKDKNGLVREETREVLFHDNTWGPSEHENTWIDSAGLKRTDYSDFRGGSLGYITDSKMRNGNYVDRILNEMLLTPKKDTVKNSQYKRLKPKEDRDKVPQYREVILEGKSPMIRDLASQIHDALFVDSESHLVWMNVHLQGKSKDELKAMISNINLAGKWKPVYEQIKQRILSDSENAIKTEEDYKKLPDDDYLKVLIEKMILKKGGYIAGLDSDIAKVRNVQDLKPLRQEQALQAINAFKYSFGKGDSKDLIEYLDDLNMSDLDKEYSAILKKYDIKLSEDEYCAPIENLKIDKTKFNGSLKTTIDLIMVGISEELEKVISNPEARAELETLFKSYISEKSYFNLADLDSREPDNKEHEHIIKFIDREFKPLDDEEFVEIYRRIQDMTTSEFEKEIFSRIKPQDTGIKEAKAWDIITQLKMHREQENIDLMNTIFYDSLVADLGKENTEAHYKYYKLTKSPRYLIAKQDFASLYRSLENDLSMLNFEKMFNKYKDRNYRQYGAFPAYPQTDLFHEEFIKTTMENLVETFEKNTDMINVMNRQIESYKLTRQLMDLVNNTNPDKKFYGEDFVALNKLLGELYTMNKSDESVQRTAKASENALELEEGASLSDYLPFINEIIDEIGGYEKTTPTETVENVIQNKKLEIEVMKKAFKNSFIQEKYRGRIGEVLNKYEKALIKDDKEAINEWQEVLRAQLIAYHILQNPKELLDSYILSQAKTPKKASQLEHVIDETDLTPYKKTYRALLQKGLNYARLLEVQSIIMESLSEGLAMNVKDKFNKYSIGLAQGEYEMGSGESIVAMVNSLLLDDQSDTALLFLEKLGLSEQYVEFMSKEFDFKEMKDTLKKIHETMMNFVTYNKILNPIFTKTVAKFSEPNANYEEILDNLSKTIYDEGLKLGFTKEQLDVLAECSTITKAALKEHRPQEATLVFETVLAKVTQEFSDVISDATDSMESLLDANQTFITLIQQISLREGSKAYIEREKIIEKFLELTDYRNSLLAILDAHSADTNLQEQ